MYVTSLNEITPPHRDLFESARRARNNAYAPYSGFRVGAAIWLRGDRMFTGCNVENAAYGPTICAERTAIVKARSEAGSLISGDILAVFVVTDSGEMPAPPCGGCRSVIAEFDTEHTSVFASNLDGSVIHVFTMGELLPYSFEREFASKLGKK